MLSFIYLLIFLIGLAQTPLLVDLLRLIFPRWRIKRLTNKISVYLLRVLMTTFFLTGLAQHTFLFVPLMPTASFRTLKLVAHCGFTYWVWLNMTVNYYLATFLSPGYCVDTARQSEETGRVDSTSPDDTATALKDHLTLPKQMSDTSTPVHSKIECSENDNPVQGHETTPVGKRLRYCSTCGKTVMYMDHHCPFTGNCVGIDNYSHFLLCLSYAWIGLCYGISISLLYFGECWFPTIWTSLHLAYLSDNETGGKNDVCTVLLPYKEYIFPVIGGFAILTILLAFQTFLLLSDLSTYEVLKNFWKQRIFKLGLDRIRQRKYRAKESRLNVLLFRRRPTFISFILPIRSQVRLCYTE